MLEYLKRLFTWLASCIIPKKDEPVFSETKAARKESTESESEIVLAPPSPPQKERFFTESILSREKNRSRWQEAMGEEVARRKAIRDAQTAEKAKQEALKQSPTTKKDSSSNTRRTSPFSLFSRRTKEQTKSNDVNYHAAPAPKRGWG